MAADAPPPLVSVPRITNPGAGQVFYFVLTDRFENGSKANDTGGIAGGPESSGFDPARINYYHGGDFIGLTSRLDYIKQLGATAIWITPPFVNQVLSPYGSGYHGYWIYDFTTVDPHLGTEQDFKRFVDEAHNRGIRVFVDIVVNHTGHAIRNRDGSTRYIPLATSPYRDASGMPFDPHAVAYNGVDPSKGFPPLSVEKSFPHVPEAEPGLAHVKKPDWLNDLTLYHNRGSTSNTGESALYGDFGSPDIALSQLDDVFTENPRVVRGFIDVFSSWIERFGIDGFRIDTVKYVNMEFWHAFPPAIRARARALGKPDFFIFGEVQTDPADVGLMSEFSTDGKLDAPLDFGSFEAIHTFIAKDGDAADLAALYAKDDLYTTHDANAQNLTAFVSNHDNARLAYYIEKGHPDASPATWAAMDLLGQELLLTARGQPVLYYGDEQGMAGFGDDSKSREDMFASLTPAYAKLPLLGTTRTGKDDKFDPSHPFYRAMSSLARLRQAHPGLRSGAMFLRPSGNQHVFAFSRLERDERVEYLVALNNSASDAAAVSLPTSEPEGARLRVLFDSARPESPDGELVVGPSHAVSAKLAPLQLVVWQAESPLAPESSSPSVALSGPTPGSVLSFTARTVGGQVVPDRKELRADVSGGDGVGEVTFVLERASRPGQFELIGTADRAPYRVYWRPPADLAKDDTLGFVATFDDLRGRRASAQTGGIRVAPQGIEFGIRGATVPRLMQQPAESMRVAEGARLTLSVSATGTGPLDFTWVHNGAIVSGAISADLVVPAASAADSGEYLALVHGPEGTAVSRGVHVDVIR
jgi:glycosidase